jgi:hypothetical protein
MDNFLVWSLRGKCIGQQFTRMMGGSGKQWVQARQRYSQRKVWNEQLMLRVSSSWLGIATKQKRSTVFDISSSRQTGAFCPILRGAKRTWIKLWWFAAERWEGGRIFAKRTISSTDVHCIFPVCAGNSVVILGNGRSRKFFPVIVQVTPTI